MRVRSPFFMHLTVGHVGFYRFLWIRKEKKA